jgi:hypothetical protein
LLEEFEAVDAPSLSQYLDLLNRFIILGQVSDDIPEPVFEFCWQLLTFPELRHEAAETVLRAVKLSSSLAMSLISSSKMAIFLTLFRSRQTFMSPMKEILASLIQSCCDVCELLVIEGLVDHLIAGFYDSEPDPQFWSSIFECFRLIAINMKPDSVLISSMFDVCMSALSEIFSEAFVDTYCQILECCIILLKLKTEVLDDRELNQFADRAFFFIKMFKNDVTRLKFLQFLKVLPNSTHFVTKKMIRSLFEEIGPNSENNLLSAFVAVLAKFLTIFPDFVEELREKGVINVVIKLLFHGELEDKSEAAKFMAVLSDGCFFAGERETFVRNPVVKELMDLIGSGMPDNDKLRITVALLNVVNALRQSGLNENERISQQFSVEEFARIADNIEWSDSENLRMHFSLLHASVRELLAS